MHKIEKDANRKKYNDDNNNNNMDFIKQNILSMQSLRSIFFYSFYILNFDSRDGRTGINK